MKQKPPITFRADAHVIAELNKLKSPSTWISAVVTAYMGYCPCCGQKWTLKDEAKPTETPDDSHMSEEDKAERDNLWEAYKGMERKKGIVQTTADSLVPGRREIIEDFEGPSAADLVPDERGRIVIYNFSEYDMQQIWGMAQIGLDDAQIAFLFGIDPLVFDRMVREQQKAFEEGDQYRWNLFSTLQRGKADGMMRIAKTAFDQAVIKKDAKLLIWMTKARLGWKEKIEVEGKIQKTVIWETQVVGGQIKRGVRELSPAEVDELDAIIDAETPA